MARAVNLVGPNNGLAKRFRGAARWVPSEQWLSTMRHAAGVQQPHPWRGLRAVYAAQPHTSRAAALSCCVNWFASCDLLPSGLAAAPGAQCSKPVALAAVAPKNGWLYPSACFFGYAE